MTLPTALAAPAAPVLLGGAVHRLLGGRDGVDRRHEAVLDAVVVVDDLGERREAVRRARRVGHDVHGGLVGLEVHAADEHGRVGRGRRDDDLLRAALEVGRGRLGLREDARRLDDVVRAAGGPVDVRRVALAEDLDLVAADGDRVARDLDGVREAAVHRVVLEHVAHVVHGDEGVVHAHDADVGVRLRRAHDEAADSSESIDTDADRHFCAVLYMAL